MRLEELRSFVAVVEEGGFTSAARRLYLAQPVVTRHIAALEKEFHARLFERTTRTVTPTPLALEFYRSINEHLAAIDKACLVFQGKETPPAASWSIGYSYLHLDKLTPSWIREFADSQPTAPHIQFHEETPENLVSGLRDGTYDAIVTGSTSLDDLPPHFDKHLIWITDEKIMVARTHRFASKDEVTFDDIADETFVYPFRPPSPINSPARRDFIQSQAVQKTINVEFDASAFDLVATGSYVIDIPVMWPIDDSRLTAVPYKSKFRIYHYFAWNPATAHGGITDLASFIGDKASGTR